MTAVWTMGTRETSVYTIEVGNSELNGFPESFIQN